MASKKNVKSKDGTKPQAASKNGKKSDSGYSSSFFTWFIVLALLGVWTSVAVVYFDLADYQGVIGKLAAYDADGDGDFDVEDAKLLLGLTTDTDDQDEPIILDWLEEVEEGGSDWLSSFFTFLYGLINPLAPMEDEHSVSGAVEPQEDEDDGDDEGGDRRRGKDPGSQGQKIVIVGLHNQ